MKCNLTIERKQVNGKEYTNLYITTPKGTNFQVFYRFYNRKLAYKVMKEIEESAKGE